MSSPQKNTSKRYSCGKLARENPRCPCCGHVFPEKHRDPAICLGCTATFQRVFLLFKDFPAILLEDYLDPGNIISGEGRSLIEAPLQSIRKRFPQVRPAFCALTLQVSIDPKLVGFWMLNSCPLGKGETERDRAWRLLLLVDQANSRLSLTAGYALECYLPDSEMRQALRRIHHLYFRGRVGEAMRTLAADLKASLEKSFRHARRLLKNKNPSA